MEITAAVGSALSLAAMALYYRYRRNGEPSGFKRFVTFMAGLPVTLILKAAVDEDPEAVFRRIDGDDDLYDAQRLERELEAFRAHKRAVEAELLPAPPTRSGLGRRGPEAGPERSTSDPRLDPGSTESDAGQVPTSP